MMSTGFKWSRYNTDKLWCQVKVIGSLASIVLICMLIGGGVASAATDLSVGYNSIEELPMGTLVTPDNQENNTVLPVNSDTNGNIIGVVVNSSSVVLQSGSDQVQVSNQGTAEVLVSNINGPIMKGDVIGRSPLSGIGMLATSSGIVAGTTQAALTSSSPDAEYKTITDKSGASKRVLIGLVPLSLNVSYYQVPDPPSNAVPGFLRSLSTDISGKQVSAARILGSLTLMILALLCAIVLVYGTVYSSISAIGRNPLAKTAIQRSMTKVLFLAAAIILAAGAVAYIILRG